MQAVRWLKGASAEMVKTWMPSSVKAGQLLVPRLPNMVQDLKLLFLASVKGDVQDLHMAGRQFLCPVMDPLPYILVKIPVVIGRSGEYGGDLIGLMDRRFAVVIHGTGQSQYLFPLFRTDALFVMKSLVDRSDRHICSFGNIL